MMRTQDSLLSGKIPCCSSFFNTTIYIIDLFFFYLLNTLRSLREAMTFGFNAYSKVRFPFVILIFPCPDKLKMYLACGRLH
jgi:hypothetical protein